MDFGYAKWNGVEQGRADSAAYVLYTPGQLLELFESR